MRRRAVICRTIVTTVLCTVIGAASGRQSQAAPRGADGELEIEVVDSESGKPIAARMHVNNSRGRPVKLNLPNAAEFGGHFYIDGRTTLPLRRGQYTFELDAGPEYRPQTGHFEIERHAVDNKRIEMKRFANLAGEGWWGGDLDVRRPSRDMPLVFRAEALQDVRTAEFAMLLGLGTRGWGLGKKKYSLAPSLQPPAPIGIARVPYAWDLPVWLARDELAAIQLIHHHSLRDGVVDNEDDGRPRDLSLFPGRRGNGRWSESVYCHVLNCGLRIPPAAGSGSGENENPVGTNRVYVFCGDTFSVEEWWENLQAGQVFVSNGPLLRPLVEGHPPGYVFHLSANGPLTLEIGLELATRDPIEYLQIIKNGAVEAEVRLAEWANRNGRLPPLVFDDSGWFLIRAVTNNEQAYQVASSGPYYVEKSGRPRISRRSVKFFLDWIDAAKQRLAEMPALDAAARQRLLAEQEFAREFFAALLSKANAD